MSSASAPRGVVYRRLELIDASRPTPAAFDFPALKLAGSTLWFGAPPIQAPGAFRS